MKRKRAELPALEKTFYTIRDLRARYGDCAASTIYRRILTEGYPRPQRFGRSNLFSVEAVHAWERVHMPLLHPPVEGEAEEIILASDEVHWNKLRRERAQLVEREAPRKRRRRR